MCKKNFLMEMKQRRGYAEMRLLLRRTNVNFSCMGEQLLEVAIMSYLENPNLTENELMQIAEENSPMQIPNGVPVYGLMADSIQSVYTRKSKKLDKEGAVMFYISSIANEIRINAILEIKEAEKGISATPEETDLMTAVCKRRMLKPKDTFKEVLNHTAGRNGYDDVDLMIGKLARYLKFDGKITIKTAINKISDFVNEILAEKNDLVF